MKVWGSDGAACGNTTPDSMRCSECGSRAHTFELYYDENVANEKAALAESVTA